MARTLTIRQRDSLRQLQPVSNPPPVISAGQPLDIYRERSPWSMWQPVLALVCVVMVALVLVVSLVMTGMVDLAEIDLATKQAELEHARLMGNQDGWSDGKVTALVAAIILGVVAVPGIAKS
jgi:ABC-type Fe3+ transport system permease subunit